MHGNTVFEERESNVRSYCRGFPVVFDKAVGPHIWDVQGNKYIDFLLGAGALNYGHNPENIKQAMLNYLADSSILQGLDLHTKAKQNFLESFEKIILKPRKLEHKVLFTGPTGTNTIEAAMKIARLATGRSQIAAFTNGFHGMTLGSLSATGNKFHRQGAGITLHGIDRYPYDAYLGNNVNTIEVIEKLLNDPSSGYEPPAAFLLETIQAEGGLNVASKYWLQKLSALAKKIGSLIIVDDIQVGCGRTGDFFSFEFAGIVPDLICLSKSISGCGLPMSLLLVEPEYDVFSPGQHNGTFRGNNLAFVSAEKALEYWQNEMFIQGIPVREKLIRNALENITQEFDGFSVRGKGMIQGLTCPSTEIAQLIIQRSFANGLVLEATGSYNNVLKLLTPLNIDINVLNEGLEILKSSVADCKEQLLKAS